jgi:hypothetical protein
MPIEHQVFEVHLDVEESWLGRGIHARSFGARIGHDRLRLVRRFGWSNTGLACV